MTPWLDFPTLTIQIATDEVTTFDLVLSPQQYLLEVKDVYNALNQLSDCYKFAVAPSESGETTASYTLSVKLHPKAIEFCLLYHLSHCHYANYH